MPSPNQLIIAMLNIVTSCKIQKSFLSRFHVLTVEALEVVDEGMFHVLTVEALEGYGGLFMADDGFLWLSRVYRIKIYILRKCIKLRYNCV